MHIPDAFIPIPQAAIYWIVALIFLAMAIRWAKSEMNEDKNPLDCCSCGRYLCSAGIQPPGRYGNQWSSCWWSFGSNRSRFSICCDIYPYPRPYHPGLYLWGWRDHYHGGQYSSTWELSEVLVGYYSFHGIKGIIKESSCIRWDSSMACLSHPFSGMCDRDVCRRNIPSRSGPRGNGDFTMQ